MARRQRLYNQRTRMKAISAYGGQCACCGETDLHFLAIDHVKGGGEQHRKELQGHQSIYQWAAKNGYPDTLRALCHNCNSAIGYYGHCPHQEEPCLTVGS